jgi:hypothetical protein
MFLFEFFASSYIMIWVERLSYVFLWDRNPSAVSLNMPSDSAVWVPMLVRMEVQSCGSLVGGIVCVGFGSIFLVVFPSLVIRLSCRVSDLVMGGGSLVCVSVCEGVAMGHISCASRWNSWMVSITVWAALSIWSVVTCEDAWSWWMVSRAFGNEDRVLPFPSWYRSIRGLGIGRMKGGWSRVVGICVAVEICGLGSPSCSISRYRAWWSLYSV